MNEVQRRVHVDSADRRYTFEIIQDVEDILENNKALAAEAQKSDWGRHTATVPLVIINRWLNEDNARGNPIRYLGPGFDAWLKKKLDDPDNKAWRVDNPSNPFYLGWRNGS